MAARPLEHETIVAGTFLGIRPLMFWIPTAFALALLGIGTSTVAIEADDPNATAWQTQAPPAAQSEEVNDPKDRAQEKEPPTPAHTGLHALFGNLGEDIKHLPATQNLYLVAIGGGLAAAAHPADQAFNRHVQSPSAVVSAVFASGKYVGDTPEQLAFSLPDRVVAPIASGSLFTKVGRGFEGACYDSAI